MYSKTLETLEFNKICQILESYSITYIGKEFSLNLKPFNNKKDIEKALKQTTEATILLYRKGSIPMSEIENIVPHIKKLESNLFLSAKQLLDLANILRLSSNLKDYFFSTEIDMSEFDNLHNLFEHLYTNRSIEKTIFSSILDEDTISDEASKELYSIRKNIKNKEQEIRGKLNSFLHSKYLQEPIITVRSGRFVIPVKNEYRSEIKGFIHDISSSGSTIFIEPISIFELNNDLNSLKNMENIEIEKILQKLSSLFFNIIKELQNNIDLIGIIDFIFAKAKYSNNLDASEPSINEEKYINLIHAWHPLLPKDIAIKNTIPIGNTYNSLIITGPNTGGKTVTLKTAGLLVLMGMSGLHIPAKEGSSIFIFDNIFADIGDEQSIAASLSTFSSHMTNIANILNLATSNSFVLIDELGSGTDPAQGSSLAISILETLNNLGALTLSTTHYPEIKHFALVSKGFENASVEFDIETLSPTYKLLLGVPGTSNAFIISEKLGISKEIIERAKTFMDNDNINIEELLNNIYEDKKTIELEKEQILENSKKIEDLKKSLETDFSVLKEKEKSLIENAKNEARDILISAKEDANEIIKELEATKNTKTANELRNSLNTKINNLKSNISTTVSDNLKLTVDEAVANTVVFIPSLNQTGTIISVSRNEKVQVQLDLGKMIFNLSDLQKTSQTNLKPKNITRSKKDFKVKAISTEINVIGQTVEEACFEIDKYLDTCALSGLATVRIVHGKGTGALRAGIHIFLKTHPHVLDFRVGTFGEGEMGVTIVNLK